MAPSQLQGWPVSMNLTDVSKIMRTSPGGHQEGSHAISAALLHVRAVAYQKLHPCKVTFVCSLQQARHRTFNNASRSCKEGAGIDSGEIMASLWWWKPSEVAILMTYT